MKYSDQQRLRKIYEFINDALQDNLSFTYYPSGHMIYVNADSLVQLHQDAEAWFGRE